MGKRDENLNQYYLRARYYSPANGRFSQRDSWLGSAYQPVTANKYLYANASPVMFTDPSGNESLMSLGTSIAIMGSLTTSANIGITTWGINNIIDNKEATPDAYLISLGISGSSRGATGEGGIDIICSNTRKCWSYAEYGAGLAPLSLFKTQRNAGAAMSIGAIWGFNDPGEWSGFAGTANWPLSVIHLIPRAIINNNRMWGVMTQLAKRSKNSRVKDLTLSIGVSTSGPVGIKVGVKSNTLSSVIGWDSSPAEVDGSAVRPIVDKVQSDFGNVIEMVR